MIIIPEKSPELAATRIYNGWIDLLTEHEKTNERRKKLYQSPIPWPEIDIKDMVERTKNLAREYYQAKTSNGQKVQGDAAVWETEAIARLKRDLLHYLREEEDAELKHQIEVQVWSYWPDTAPPPDLNPEQTKKLLELQGRADELQESLMQTVINTLDELAGIVTEEIETIKNTSAASMRLMYNQASWFKLALVMLINEHGAGPNPLKSSRQSKPRGWRDK
ncbi:MAG TPA: hypothetical protein VEG39_08470 [Clostridia bacterium]|nr:hypothetical protein [Clostridia bacterium]